MSDHSQMKLGKRTPRHDPRTLKLARYLTPSLPTAPASVDYSRGFADWGMLLNDQLGCCTISAIGHAIQAWTMNSGSRVDFINETVRFYYEKWDGYNPADPTTDQGGVELDVLNAWRNNKFGFAGRKLDAFVAVHTGTEGQVISVNPADIRLAIWMFGGAYIGVELPLRAQNQDVWGVVGDFGQDAPGSWGGHAIYLVAYDENFLTCVTWGQLKKMTWGWFQKYCSEAYGLLSEDWIESSGIAPSGYDLDALKKDLELVTV